MGYYLQIDKSDPQPLASSTGWGDFGRWVETLDVDAYGQLVHLAEWGWCQNVPDLTRQLDAAIEAEPSDIDGVPDTADNLLGMLEDAEDAVVAFVTDGMGPDDEKETDDEQ